MNGDQHKLNLTNRRVELEPVKCSNIKRQWGWVEKPVTYQLDGGHILLPPQVLLVGRSHGGESIVGVHYDMDGAVQQGMEGSQAT